MKKVLATLFILTSCYSGAEDRFAKVEIEAKAISENIYVLYGSGGNIGALTGEDGTLIIDDQFEPLAPKIEQALADLNDAQHNNKVSYVVNTHYHGDHTGGNVYFSKSASVLAHENVRKRMSVKSKQGLPVVTYEQGIKLHLNGERIHVKHLAKGHTDGDSVVYFEKANVWHLGDLFFESRFPFIDLNSGGNVTSYIGNIETLLTMINDDAAIIPGHGKLTDKKGLQSYLTMLRQTSEQVLKMKQQGVSLEQAIETGLGEKWQNWSWQFINESRWITTLYKGQ